MKFNLLFLLIPLFLFSEMDAQRRGNRDQSASEGDDKSLVSASTISGLNMRNIGPAFCSGRIADMAIHPEDDNVWYVAVGSGGVWKTENAGVTWQSLFDGQKSYSTGCVTIDPNNPHTVWVGSGENVGGRHVGYGDGVYVSKDDGKSWKNMGLKESQHISKIIVHPSNPNVIWVAAQGPLWNKGGERGLYKSVDGGENWRQVLGNNEWTGVTDIAMDPRDPDMMYAATWDRHRTVAAYMGGGPGSGIHRSMDGGETWEELKSGLPRSDMGKIGLALSPHDADVIYAVIELDRKSGGVYKSSNRGASWQKQSSTVSGGTGPHYYQELYASPHAEGRLYLMDVRIQVSDDGGKTFRRLSESQKHSDNHAIAFRADDPDYLLVGTDAGIYESFDLAENWRFIDNLPLTQYYKVAVDDQKPFYHIFGGTQDNGSHGGPSRTDTRHGIRNADWYTTLGADGHQSATEPGNNNIGYAETQQGGLHRIDRITGEQVYIQPQAGEGEGFERFNWDAPILVSPHKPSRLYFASHRVWRSEDRGDSWTAISGDLTKNQERITLPIMGKQQSWDAAWDIGAMSNYNTISSLAESPVQEGVVYAGTDDGIIQVTEDGGQNWRKINTNMLPGVPATAFVNDIKADLYDANTVYVALDNHKYGDFKPYLLKSTDRGRSWNSIVGDLPAEGMVWRMVQDHVAPSLLFAAAEGGVFTSIDGGKKWMKIKCDANIAFRDLVIQKRENDLVAASFGRGFFVLDDYSALREISEEALQADAKIFATRDALWYSPRSVQNSMGASNYTASNPDFGAVFTYYLKEGTTTLKGERKKAEGKLKKEGKDIPFPGWDALEAERLEEKAKVMLVIKNDDGDIIQRLDGRSGKGVHRTAWNLRMQSKGTVALEQRGSGRGGFRRGGGGMMVTPGTYTVSLVRQENGEMTTLAGPESFNVVPLRKGALPGKSMDEIAAFAEDVQNLQNDVAQMTETLEKCNNKVAAMQTAAGRTSKDASAVIAELFEVKTMLNALNQKVNGNQSKGEIGERNPPNVRGRMFIGFRGMTTYGPTDMHKESIAIAKKELAALNIELKEIAENRIPAIENKLKEVGAPRIEGQVMPGGN